jgi:hypothetical protein
VILTIMPAATYYLWLLKKRIKSVNSDAYEIYIPDHL